jgi:DNA-3-methyladenine glycosylase
VEVASAPSSEARRLDVLGNGLDSPLRATPWAPFSSNMSAARSIRPRRLSRRFFARPAQMVARALLGKVLVHGARAGIIVETEAYLGQSDLASHARFGRTRRNEVMFGQAGMAYIYLCYGMYDLFNVVTGAPGEPQAVLIRALEPLAGMDPAPDTARGPGKLTRALGLSRAHNRVDLVESAETFLRPGRRVVSEHIAVGPRIGVDYAGAWASEPLRFWIADHRAVSRPPRRHAAAAEDRR